MDSQTFVDVLRIAVREPAISQTIGYIAAPPGRSVPSDVQAMSSWFNSLEPHDRALLSAIVERAVDAAVFGVLCVIDGVRAIENGPERGILRLTYISESETVLNPSSGPLLHELYR